MLLNEMNDTPVFDKEKCNCCGLCVSVCLHGGFIMVEQVVLSIDSSGCIHCQQCELVCPAGAISFPFEVVDES